jgi:hypothetical protein
MLLIPHFAAGGVKMQTAHPAILLQDAHPVTGLTVLISALHAQHPATGGFTRSIGGPVRIGELPGRRRIIAFPGLPPGLRHGTGGDQQTGQRYRYRSPQSL